MGKQNVTCIHVMEYRSSKKCPDTWETREILEDIMLSEHYETVKASC